MAYAYSEDQLIQKSAADLLENELGWQSVYAFDKETLGADGTLGRQSYAEVLLLRELRSALLRLNGWMTDRQVSEAVDVLKLVV